VVSLEEDYLDSLTDRLIGVIIRDNTKLDAVLSKHDDVRQEVEPVLDTALKIGAIKHPEMSAEARKDFKERVLASGKPGGPG